MRIFTCSACKNMVFFENVQCTNCGHDLAYIPEHNVVSALSRSHDRGARITGETRFTALVPVAKRARYRLCKNGVEHAVCNWLIREDDPDEFCRACRLNVATPDLDKPEAWVAWRKLERAKRRLVYTLTELGLPIESRAERPEKGLAFAFLSDGDNGQKKVFTGHADGLITINTAEADDPFREQIRKEMDEAYRTLLGHMRHEVGHYYWDHLIRDSEWLEPWRALFGDERADYAGAMQRHYKEGAPADWALRFVSAYATMHPWEDWAETWAHYLHMVDTLGTARAHGVVLRAKAVGGAAAPTLAARRLDFEEFDDLIAGWVPLTLALNSLNRSMGLADPYPFVLSKTGITKLRFVHDVITYWQAIPSALEQVLRRWRRTEAEPSVAAERESSAAEGSSEQAAAVEPSSRASEERAGPR